MKPIIITKDPMSDVVLERGGLAKVGKHFDLKRRVLVLTDRGVPAEYADRVCADSLYPVRVSVWPGDEVNSLDNYTLLFKAMLENQFESSDCIVAVGGEKIMELGGFLAATYKGGMDHYCVPTSLKAQTGCGILATSYLNFESYKNAMGTRHLPKRTLVDTDTLETLGEIRVANGYAEIMKLAIALDSKLFEMLERDDMPSSKILEKVLARAMEVRRYICLNERTNSAIHTVVNIGSTISDSMEKTKFSYGERLAISILPFCSPDVRARLRSLFGRYELPIVWQYDAEQLFRDSIRNYNSDRITVARCDEIGACKVDSLTIPEYHKLINAVYGS